MQSIMSQWQDKPTEVLIVGAGPAGLYDGMSVGRPSDLISYN